MSAGYSAAELDDAQGRFDLKFPPDLVALLLRTRRIVPRAYDWTHDRKAISEAIAWPLEGLHFDLAENDLWLDQWGERPASLADRKDVLNQVYATAPNLIPLRGHRYLPEMPSAAGNPVLSVYQSDIIYYGVDLQDWVSRETHGWSSAPWPEIQVKVPFWTDLVDANC
jgi:hypothetical protein